MDGQGGLAPPRSPSDSAGAFATTTVRRRCRRPTTSPAPRRRWTYDGTRSCFEVERVGSAIAMVTVHQPWPYQPRCAGPYTPKYEVRSRTAPQNPGCYDDIRWGSRGRAGAAPRRRLRAGHQPVGPGQVPVVGLAPAARALARASATRAWASGISRSAARGATCEAGTPGAAQRR